MSIAARAAKAITWTFDPTVAPENDIIRETILTDSGRVFNGSNVSIDKGLGFIPVYAAVRVISEVMASLPLQVYERLEPRGKRLAPEHRLYDILHRAPNPEMSSFVYREQAQSHIEAWGNHFAEIEYDRDGFPLHLWPLRPDNMQVGRENGKLVYLYRLPEGKEVKLSRRQVFHVPGISFNGLVGHSPIQMVRKGLALAMATEEMAGRYYDNDARPGVVLKHPGELSTDAAKRLAESFDATHSGLTNKHRTAVLEEGMDIETVGFPAEDSQLIEQQRWSIPQTSRIFNLSPHMLHDLERSTFNNIEESNLNVSTFQFGPRAARFQQQVNLQLLVDDPRHFSEINMDGLMRGRTLDRMQAYWQRFQMGSLSPNDIRALENDNPIDGGDVYYVAANLSPVAGDDSAPVLPEIPPLELMAGGIRSMKAADDRKRIAERYRPLFERVTRELINFEQEQVLAEAERRFAA